MKNTIKVERAKVNITQDELAKILNVSRQTVYSIEKNVYIPSTVIALKIAHFFNVKVEDIFTLETSD
jgi:putative transcriptional regulator